MTSSRERSTLTSRALVVCLGLASILGGTGCGAVMAPGDAGSDASPLDASPLDASSLDGHAPSVDASPGDAPSVDAYSIDASLDAWSLDASWGSCSASGVTGTCMDMSLCTGERMAVMGLCPGPAAIQCCIPRGDSGPTPDTGPRPDGGMCDPDDMPLPNVGLIEAVGEGGCPSGMVPVTEDLCVDRYEASLVEVLADGSSAEWSPFHNPGARRVRALSREGAVPQAYIDGVRARAACEEAGKRLCTDTEWLRACQGSEGFTYPYGNTRRTGVCNDHRARHPAAERFGTTESWIYSRLDDACIDQLPMSLATSGAFDGCVSESGALDMMGNLHEWTADPAGTFRGGYYVDTVINGNGCLYRTTAHDMGHWDYSTGFRCCADR